MRLVVLSVLFAPYLCAARSHCPNPRLQNPTIGGNVIVGYVELNHKPLQFAKVKVYSSSGKRVWVGATDTDGMFATGEMLPGDYTIKVAGWGSGNVRLDPDLFKEMGPSRAGWHLLLFDPGCVGTMANGN